MEGPLKGILSMEVLREVNDRLAEVQGARGTRCSRYFVNVAAPSAWSRSPSSDDTSGSCARTASLSLPLGHR